MNCSFLKAAAVAVVAAVLVATAAATSYVSAAPLPAGLLSPHPFLWIAANIIVIWLVSSYRHHKTAAASSDSHADDVSAAVNSLYPSSEHDVFAAAVAPDPFVVSPISRRKPREAKTAKWTDRPRVRKKLAGVEKPRPVAAEAKPGDKKPSQEEKPRTVPTESKPDGKKPGEEKPRTIAAEAKPNDSDDVSMDSMWQAILQRGAALPVAVPKIETWGCDELPRLEQVAEKAVERREMRKSATMVPPSPQHPAAAAPAAKQGWRTRDVLVMAHDELLRRAESFIRRQHEQRRLQRQESEQRLQRQESEQRQAMEHQRRRHLALIRV